MAVLKVLVLAAVLCVAVAHASDVSVDADAEMDARPRKGKKLVSPRVLKGKALMAKKNVVIVPKGDPRARAPEAFPTAAPTSPATGVVLKSSTFTTSAACAAKPGRCVTTASCTELKGVVFRGVCPGVSVCCTQIPAAATTPAPTTPTPTTPAAPVANCPFYGTQPITKKAGNGNIVYDTVLIKREHMSEPAKYGISDTQADNTMRLTTACAFARLEAAASAAGVKLTINSGFRTLARQQYFYNCFKTGKCNGGNRAAVPGNSNHGVGLALDLNTDCGKQPGNKAPAACKSSKVYMYLLNNYKTHGFIRAVKDEPWHWEYRPGQAMPAWAAV